METKRTNAKADSSAHPRATRRTSRRPSKLALLRVKVATIFVAVVLFFASLAGIAVYNPGVSNAAAVQAQPQQITIVQPGGSNSRVVVPPPRVNAVRPLVRSRGS